MARLVLIQSNGVTVATGGANLFGAYTIHAPGSGNAPGVAQDFINRQPD